MKTQKPVKTPTSSYAGKTDAYEETHPAYAVIGASRVSSTGTRLFNSEFKHGHYVTISIRAANMNRDLSRDWVHGGKEYIEVALSESQWAAFVSSMNCGDGVPCTLGRRNGEMIPGIEGEPETKTTFKKEMTETLKVVTDALTELKKKITETKLSGKAQQDLLDTLYKAQMNLQSNLPFVSNSFSEHIETTLDKAKIEVGAYIQGAISRAGLEALQGQAPIQIEFHEVKEIGEG